MCMDTRRMTAPVSALINFGLHSTWLGLPEGTVPWAGHRHKAEQAYCPLEEVSEVADPLTRSSSVPALATVH